MRLFWLKLIFVNTTVCKCENAWGRDVWSKGYHKCVDTTCRKSKCIQFVSNMGNVWYIWKRPQHRWSWLAGMLILHHINYFRDLNILCSLKPVTSHSIYVELNFMQVYPFIFKDNRSRLFIYWTVSKSMKLKKAESILCTRKFIEKYYDLYNYRLMIINILVATI